MRPLLTLLIAILMANVSLAQTRNKVRIRNVNLKGENKCSYSYYLPRDYQPKKTYPAIFCFAPDGKGRLMLARYVRACERVGWIAIASNDSINGPMKLPEIEAMRADCLERFSIDPNRIFVSGFSGGARVATFFAAKHQAAGHLAIGGLFVPPTRLPLDKSTLPHAAYFLLCGHKDPNLVELQKAEQLLSQLDWPVQLQTFAGGHQMPGPAQIEEAILWLSDFSASSPVD